MKIIILSSTLWLLFSCNNQQQEKEDSSKTTTTKSLANCYRYINNKDTVTLKIASAGESVTGDLVYQLNEKDKNRGTIAGQMKGDLLIADYSFFSEGVKSVRQVAFKKTGNSFVEGYGNAVDQNGKMVFKNIDSLDFTHSFLLKEVNCVD